MIVTIIALTCFVTVGTFVLCWEIDRRREESRSEEAESTDQLKCILAPRSGEDENWQVRTVFTTPIGTRCQYYIEVNSNATECEAVKLACEQAIGFLRNVRF